MNRNARSRSEDSARLKDETGAVAGIITVNYAANGKVGIFHWTNVGYDSAKTATTPSGTTTRLA